MSNVPVQRTFTAEASLELTVSLERVWAVLIDLQNAPRWHPTWRTVSILESARRGTAFGLSAPLPGNAWVTRFEPPSTLEVLYFPHLMGVREESRFDLRSIGLEKTQIALTSSSSGLLAPLFSGRAREGAQRVLAGLERYLRQTPS